MYFGFGGYFRFCGYFGFSGHFDFMGVLNFVDILTYVDILIFIQGESYDRDHSGSCTIKIIWSDRNLRNSNSFNSRKNSSLGFDARFT